MQASMAHAGGCNEENMVGVTYRYVRFNARTAALSGVAYKDKNTTLSSRMVFLMI